MVKCKASATQLSFAWTEQLYSYRRGGRVSHKNNPAHRERCTLVEQGLKRCNNCRVIKPLADFPSHSAAHRNCIGGVGNTCVECYLRDQRDLAMKRNYGITMEEYRTMFAAQGFSCAICGEAGKSPDTLVRSRRRGPSGVLVVDHDHTTGKVRGLLCNSCNNALGSFKDDPNLLQRAAAYLLMHSTL
jgi:Recombination endonuclease VII